MSKNNINTAQSVAAKVAPVVKRDGQVVTSPAAPAPVTPISQEALIAQLMAEREALMAEKEALLKARTLSGGLKVSEKGAISMYGLGRFPVTLYREQWEKLFVRVDEVKAFIKANETLLKVKPAKE